jgi:hypothetical protein
MSCSSACSLRRQQCAWRELHTAQQAAQTTGASRAEAHQLRARLLRPASCPPAVGRSGTADRAGPAGTPAGGRASMLGDCLRPAPAAAIPHRYCACGHKALALLVWPMQGSCRHAPQQLTMCMAAFTSWAISADVMRWNRRPLPSCSCVQFLAAACCLKSLLTSCSLRTETQQVLSHCLAFASGLSRCARCTHQTSLRSLRCPTALLHRCCGIGWPCSSTSAVLGGNSLGAHYPWLGCNPTHPPLVVGLHGSPAQGQGSHGRGLMAKWLWIIWMDRHLPRRHAALPAPS